MNCPHCNIPLSMADRAGIEIDFCPQCRGVWLDRGELDKIIERSRQPVAPGSVAYGEGDQRSRDDGYRRYGEGHGNEYRGKKYRKKKGVGDILGDIFDL